MNRREDIMQPNKEYQGKFWLLKHFHTFKQGHQNYNNQHCHEVHFTLANNTSALLNGTLTGTCVPKLHCIIDIFPSEQLYYIKLQLQKDTFAMCNIFFGLFCIRHLNMLQIYIENMHSIVESYY